MPRSLSASLTFPCDLDDRNDTRVLAKDHGVTQAEALRVLLDLGLHDMSMREAWERALDARG